MAPLCTGMDPCPGPEGLPEAVALPRLLVATSLGPPGPVLVPQHVASRWMGKVAFPQAGFTLAPSSWLAAASLQAPCRPPQPPLPAPPSLGGTEQQRGCPRTRMGMAGDARAALHQPRRVLSFPSPSSGRGCVPPDSLCLPPPFRLVPIPARASPQCCPVPTGPRLAGQPQPSPAWDHGRSGCWGPAGSTAATRASGGRAASRGGGRLRLVLFTWD